MEKISRLENWRKSKNVGPALLRDSTMARRVSKKGSRRPRGTILEWQRGRSWSRGVVGSCGSSIIALPHVDLPLRHVKRHHNYNGNCHANTMTPQKVVAPTICKRVKKCCRRGLNSLFPPVSRWKPVEALDKKTRAIETFYSKNLAAHVKSEHFLAKRPFPLVFRPLDAHPTDKKKDPGAVWTFIPYEESKLDFLVLSAHL